MLNLRFSLRDFIVLVNRDLRRVLILVSYLPVQALSLSDLLIELVDPVGEVLTPVNGSQDIVLVLEVGLHELVVVLGLCQYPLLLSQLIFYSNN